MCGFQIGLLDPAFSVAFEHIGGAGTIGDCVGGTAGWSAVFQGSTDDNGITGNGHGGAEIIAQQSVTTSENRLLCPGISVADENISGAGGAIFVEGSHDEGVSGECHGATKAIVGGQITWLKIGLLHPTGAVVLEDVD